MEETSGLKERVRKFPPLIGLSRMLQISFWSWRKREQKQEEEEEQKEEEKRRKKEGKKKITGMEV